MFPHFPLLESHLHPFFSFTIFSIILSHFVSCFLVFPHCIHILSFYLFTFPLHQLVPLPTQHVSYFPFSFGFLLPLFIYMLVSSPLLHFPPLPQFFLLSFPTTCFKFSMTPAFFFFHLPLAPLLPFRLTQTSPSSPLPPLAASSDLLPALPPFSPSYCT